MAARSTPTFGGHAARNSQQVESLLDELLLSPPFRTSKRCQALLSYVVRETLADRADRLKERTIGVDVFGREPSYDTNHDAVVRNAAAEVRKRLAQFYVEHEHAIRIELPLGSYVPCFVDQPAAEKPAPASLIDTKSTWPSRSGLKGLAAASALAVLILLVVWRSAVPSAHRAMDRFWAPVFNERETVQLCVGQPLSLFVFSGDRATQLNKSMDANAPGSLDLSELEKVPDRYLWLGDAQAMLKLGALLEAHGKTFSQRIGPQTRYSDLRGSPAVLIGAFNNDWTLRLTSDLRYFFVSNKDARTNAIVDREHRDDVRWRVSTGVPRSKLVEDYALMTRLMNPATERTVVSVAGITDLGTLEAAEFLTDAAYMEKAFQHAPANWDKKNVQVVLKTRIVGGTPGPPSVEAIYFWN
jgi:hypothetical protein